MPSFLFPGPKPGSRSAQQAADADVTTAAAPPRPHLQQPSPPIAAPHCCRICFSDDTRSNLLAPCACKGSSRFVHRACLDTWRSRSVDAFTSCTTCNQAYKLRTARPVTQSWRSKLLFVLYVLRDLSKLVLAAFAIILAAGFAALRLDARFAWCEPSCQTPAALLAEQAGEIVGPVCVACGPLAAMLTGPLLDPFSAALAVGSTLIFASVGLGLTITNLVTTRHFFDVPRMINRDNAGSVALTFFALVGVAFALYFAGKFIFEKAKTHAQALRLISLTSDYVVVDVDDVNDASQSNSLTTDEVREVAQRAMAWQAAD